MQMIVTSVQLSSAHMYEQGKVCVCVCVGMLVDLLESFENHPPIVLPSAGFRVDLDSECVEDSIYRQLLYVRHYLWGLRTKTQTHGSGPAAVHTHSNGTNTADWPDVQVGHTLVSSRSLARRCCQMPHT